MHRLFMIYVGCLCVVYPFLASCLASSGFFGFFNLHEFIEVISPSFLWPSDASARVCCGDQCRIPRCYNFCQFVFTVCVAILVASRHFSFVCISFDVVDPVFYFFVCSTRFVVCIAFKGGVAVLVTSDASAFPSSHTVHSPLLLLSSSVTSFSLYVFFSLLYFLLVCATISRSILRWVDRTIFSCSIASVHVPTWWVRDTCLIVGLLPLMIIFIMASLSSKMYNSDLFREMCVRRNLNYVR